MWMIWSQCLSGVGSWSLAVKLKSIDLEAKWSVTLLDLPEACPSENNTYSSGSQRLL